MQSAPRMPNLICERQYTKEELAQIHNSDRLPLNKVAILAEPRVLKGKVTG